MRTVHLLLPILVALVGCTLQDDPAGTTSRPATQPGSDVPEVPARPPVDPANVQLATFAGGCFWCVEKPFDHLPGVVEAVSGYSGGHVVNPTYEAVCAGTTGHTEAVQITYDASRISYADLLEVFWRQIDPTDAGGQFVDRGTQYRSEIFYHDEAQRKLAEASKAKLAASGRFQKPIVTAVTKLDRFYRAEEYHQDFYRKKPGHYERYRYGSGRDQFLDRVWGKDRVYIQPAAKGAKVYSKPSLAEIRQRLTPIQYQVTQEDGTEPPFRNEFWDNKREGIYVDIVSGEPLFSSKDKFKSGTGWPSFTRPLVPDHITSKTDYKIGYARTEVRSKHADSHLGHVFPDGPPPTGQRYCINSAALRFVPKEDLEKEGYGEYSARFEAPTTRPRN